MAGQLTIADLHIRWEPGFESQLKSATIKYYYIRNKKKIFYSLVSIVLPNQLNQSSSFQFVGAANVASSLKRSPAADLSVNVKDILNRIYTTDKNYESPSSLCFLKSARSKMIKQISSSEKARSLSQFDTCLNSPHSCRERLF